MMAPVSPALKWGPCRRLEGLLGADHPGNGSSLRASPQSNKATEFQVRVLLSFIPLPKFGLEDTVPDAPFGRFRVVDDLAVSRTTDAGRIKDMFAGFYDFSMRQGLPGYVGPDRRRRDHPGAAPA